MARSPSDGGPGNNRPERNKGAIAMLTVKTPDEALEIAYGIKGKDASVVVIPDGVSVMAVKG